MARGAFVKLAKTERSQLDLIATERYEDRRQFRATPYEAVSALFKRLSLPSGHWVEPCAGNGDLIQHVARACDELGRARPTFWTAIELGRSAELHSLAAGNGVTRDIGRVWAHDRTNFLDYAAADDSVSVVITNLPWYGIAPIIHQAWALYKHAHVVGLCCVREPLDGDRPDFFAEHSPDWYLCRGRLPFGHRTGYPHPVAWLHWPPEGRARKRGTWEVL